MEIVNSGMRITITVKIDVPLDNIHLKIIDIFRKFPSKGLRAHQLRDHLEYEGFQMGYGNLRSHLLYLSLVGILNREKGSHYDRYYLREEFQNQQLQVIS